MSPAVGLRLTLPVIAGVLLAGPAAHAEDFYAGKQISIVVGSNVGGAYDAMARLIGRRLSQYIPGNPNIIFKNMPGAASRTAAAWVYSSAAKDGLTIGAVSPQALLESLFGDASQVKYDAMRFEFIGSAASLAYLCVVRFDAPVQSFEEAQKTEVIMGTSAPGSAGYETTMALKRVLGAQFRLFRGSQQSRDGAGRREGRNQWRLRRNGPDFAAACFRIAGQTSCHRAIRY